MLTIDGHIHTELVELLSPLLRETKARPEYISKAFGNESSIEYKLDFGGSAEVFSGYLVRELCSISNAMSEGTALYKFLDVIKQELTNETQCEKVEEIIAAIRQKNKPSTEVSFVPNSQFLSSSLIEINFIEQERTVRRTLKQHKIASFLICDEDVSGISVLVKRLTSLSQIAKAQSLFRVNMSKVGARTERIWARINAYLKLEEATDSIRVHNRNMRTVENSGYYFCF